MESELYNKEEIIQDLDNLNYDDQNNQKEIQLGAPQADGARKKKKKKKKKIVEDQQYAQDQQIEQQQEQIQDEAYAENKQIVESALDSFRAATAKKPKQEEIIDLNQNNDALDQILQQDQHQVVQLEDGNYQQIYYDQQQEQDQINNQEGFDQSTVKKKKKKKKKKPVENSEIQDGNFASEIVNPEGNYQENNAQQNYQMYGTDQGVTQNGNEQKADIDQLINQLQQDDHQIQNQQNLATQEQNNVLFTDNNLFPTHPNNTMNDTEQNELVPAVKTKKKKKKKKVENSTENEENSRVVLLVDSINHLEEQGNSVSDQNLSPEKQRIIKTAEKHNIGRDQIIYEEEQKEVHEDFNQSMYKGVNQSLVYGNQSQLNESLVQDDQKFIRENQDNNIIRSQSRMNNDPIVLNQAEDNQEQFQADQNNQMSAPYGNNSLQHPSEFKQSGCKRICTKLCNWIQYQSQTKPFEQKSNISKFFSSNPQLLRPQIKPLDISFGNNKVNSQLQNSIAPAKNRFTFTLHLLLQIILKKINVYFFFLGVIASVIYWKNSRNFPCMIALYLFSVFSQLIIDYNLKKRNFYLSQAVDDQTVQKSSNRSFISCKRGELRQGDIVKVKQGEFLPADLFLVASSSEVIFISLDSHGSQSGFQRKYVPQQIRELDKSQLISNAFSIEGTIKSNYDTLSIEGGKWEGTVKSSAINSGNEFQITEDNIGIKNMRLLNSDFLIGIVLFTSQKSKYNGVNFERQTFSHILNSFISLHVFFSLIFIIVFAIIFAILGSSFASEALNNYPYLKQVDPVFKVFMNYLVILTSTLPTFLYPVLGAIDLFQTYLINRMPDDWDDIIESQKQMNAISFTQLDQEMKPLDASKSYYETKPKQRILKSEKEFQESKKKLNHDDEKKSRIDLNKSTATQQEPEEKNQKKEISKYKEIIFDGQKISFLGNLNVIVSDLENVNERYTEFQGFTAYDIGFDQNNNSHLFDGMGERQIQQVVKLFKFGLMSNGKHQQTKEDIALKEYCEKLEIFYSDGEEQNQFVITTMNVQENFTLNFQQAPCAERPYQTSYISRSSDNQLLMRGSPEVVMEKMIMDSELSESIKLSIKQFRARGYTCQILATKYVDDRFFAVLNDLKQNTVQADQLLANIENNLEYLGLFAFKTFYRDPFNRLIQSSIKPWYLTEQHYNQQQNIFKENSLAPTFRISQQDPALLMKEIDFYFKQYKLNQFGSNIVSQISSYKIKYNMESDAKVLYTLFSSQDQNIQLFKVMFFTMMLHAQNCVIWGITPLLKQTLISQVKGCISPSLNFLAIGSSEKDIPLMQTSDVSLVYSKEGEEDSNQQAILPYADGKFTSFKQLNYLVLSYGRQHYHKSQQLCTYMIEKSIIFTTLELVYAFHSMYSGQLFFCNLIYFFYEFLFANWGAAFFYLLDFDIQMYQQIEYPQVYLQGSLHKLISIPKYFYRAILSLCQGIFIFFITSYTLQEAVDGTGVVMNHGFTQICALFTVFNLMKYKQIVHSTNISYHYWVMVVDYILFIIVMFIIQTKGVSRISYNNLDKMVSAFFSSTSSFFIFLTIGFICLIPEIIQLVNERLINRNPIYKIIGFNYGLYERRVGANVPILTQNIYYTNQVDNFAKIVPEEKSKIGLKKLVS
ncbi:hypothetical protein ABPG74_003011 [Tetrahymena malaccensis]